MLEQGVAQPIRIHVGLVFLHESTNGLDLRDLRRMAPKQAEGAESRRMTVLRRDTASLCAMPESHSQRPSIR